MIGEFFFENLAVCEIVGVENIQSLQEVCGCKYFHSEEKTPELC